MNGGADKITNQLILFSLILTRNALTSMVMNHMHVVIQKPLTLHTRF